MTAAFAASNNYAAAVVFALLAALFARQTGRVKFVFDDEAMQIFSQKKDESTGEIVNTSNENVVVGGENRWKYNTWNDWYFIPSPAFPILFYFNENQTNGPEKGQVHLFPCILDAKQLGTMVEAKVGKPQKNSA